METHVEYIIVKSSMDENIKYTVTVTNWLPVSCTCPGWIYSENKPYVCKHMDSVWNKTRMHVEVVD